MNEEGLPPNNEEAEWFLLACCIEKPEVMVQVTAALFYDPVAKPDGLLIVNEACARIPDPDQSAERLWFIAKEKPAVFARLEKACNNLPSAENWSYWLKILQDLSHARRVFAIKERLSSIAEEVARGDSQSLLKIERELREMGNGASRFGIRTYKEILPNVVNQIEEDFSSDGRPRGISTGLPDVDVFLGGLQKGRLYVVGARPSVGKSSLCLSFAESAAGQGVKTLVCSLEMSAEELAGRTVSSFARVNMNSFRSRRPEFRAGEREMVRTVNAFGKVAKLPILVADRISTLSEITAACQTAISEGAGLIVVDYLQLIRIPHFKGNRNELVTEISSTLKAIAHTNQIPVVAAAQLGRQSEREKRRPNISDLRDSGSIEQDADTILLLHALEREEGAPVEDVSQVEVSVAKNRGGFVGPIKLVFLKQFTRFESASRISPDDVPSYHQPHND